MYAQFEQIAERLERHYRDVQDLEFTIERGKLFMLQTRNAKRTAEAAVKIALDLVAGRSDRRRAVGNGQRAVAGSPLSRAHRSANERSGSFVRGSARPMERPPVRSSFRQKTPWRGRSKGAKRSSCERKRNPDDVHGMIAAEGILTAKGGATCARGRGCARDGQAVRRWLRRLCASIARKSVPAPALRSSTKGIGSRLTARPATSPSGSSI